MKENGRFQRKIFSFNFGFLFQKKKKKKKRKERGEGAEKLGNTTVKDEFWKIFKESEMKLPSEEELEDEEGRIEGKIEKKAKYIFCFELISTKKEKLIIEYQEKRRNKLYLSGVRKMDDFFLRTDHSFLSSFCVKYNWYSVPFFTHFKAVSELVDAVNSFTFKQHKVFFFLHFS